MRPFELYSKCLICGCGDLENINKIAACKAKATEVPLRCVWCADKEEIANFPTELFKAAEGKIYRPVTKIVEVEYDLVVVERHMETVDGHEVEIPERSEKRVRKERVIDLEATLAAGEIYPPKTIKHVHRQCLRCGTEWPEQLTE